MHPRIIIASRSFLALNVYKLLLSKRRPNIVSAQRFETARPWFFRTGKIDLAIFHSDVFAPRFDGYWSRLKEDEPFAKIPKIFVCKPSSREKEWQEKLKELPNSYIIERPFNPVDFEKIISEVLDG